MQIRALQVSEKLDGIRSEAKRRVSTYRMIGEEDISKEYTLEVIKDLLKLKEKVQETIDFIYMINAHTCTYNEDDYCSICGRDGRA